MGESSDGVEELEEFLEIFEWHLVQKQKLKELVFLRLRCRCLWSGIPLASQQGTKGGLLARIDGLS